MLSSVMIVQGIHRTTIWLDEADSAVVRVIDQRRLPFELVVHAIRSSAEAAHAIAEMIVRGAPLIGVTAAYGLYLAAIEAPGEARFGDYLRNAAAMLRAARPTAVNLAWALDRALAAIDGTDDRDDCIERLRAAAEEIAREDAAWCRRIGEHGARLIEEIARHRNGEPVNVLTHCNAGWLACVDYGTATAPIYIAHDRGVNLHVWVEETRPRNQGARLTAWELAEHGVPHTLIVDNAGGHLMQHGKVDMVIVGCDRATRAGDACNKIGTYLKALAARDNNIPFYVALPSSTFDWSITDGVAEIPIEERSPDEVACIEGLVGDRPGVVRIAHERTAIANPGFDVTPARLVTAFITERGICAASEEGIGELFPEHAARHAG
jgi:methylthioribose-1-phosphate isomerase